MKKFTIILSALLICLSFAGCTEDNGMDLTEDTSAEVIETESLKSEETAKTLTETEPHETISEYAPGSAPDDTVQELETTQPPITTTAATTTATATENTLPPETETETDPPEDSEADTVKDETTSDSPNKPVDFYPVEAPSFFERETIETFTNPPPLSSTAIIEPPPRDLY